VLAFGTQVRRVQTRAETVGFFRAKKKILSTPSFRREVKVVVSHVADLRHVKKKP
jgi:hypothetical protein